ETRSKPRQMWELNPQVEESLANRSIWLRGLGVGKNVGDILPLLERSGAVAQRVRVYRMGNFDQWGQFAVYATYEDEEAANLNLLRLSHAKLNDFTIHAMKALPTGAYRPLTDEMKGKMTLSMMTKEEKYKIMQKRKAMEKLKKIRQLNENLRVGSGSPGGEVMKPSKEEKISEASTSKEENRLKRKSGDETQAFHQGNVDKKRIRREEMRMDSKWREESQREERMERRGPHTPPTPEIIDPTDEEDSNPFLREAEESWSNNGLKSTGRRNRRGGKKRRALKR
ncbi:hypothetical protein PFISCL1PPCAC_27443, partial [Pristionchus fissidentatus]